MSQTKCLEHYGVQNIGPTTSGIRTAIRSATSVVKGLDALYGFGSFFRGTRYSDIDLLAVARSDNTDTLATYYQLAAELKKSATHSGVRFHLTLLTHAEFLERPLRDMHELQLIVDLSSECPSQQRET